MQNGSARHSFLGGPKLNISSGMFVTSIFGEEVMVVIFYIDLWIGKIWFFERLHVANSMLSP